MNLGGIKTSSAELERVCGRVSGVRESAAVAVAPAAGPEELVVFAVAESGSAAESLREAMNAALRRELNPLFKVARVVLVDQLPRTASNKILRRQLRDPLRSDDAAERRAVSRPAS